MSTEEQTDEQGRRSDAGAPPASDIMAAARTLYPDTAEPQVRLAALMAALDAQGQELIVNVLEAYSAWDHYVTHHPSRTAASPPLTIPGMQTPAPEEAVDPLEALALAVTELASRVAVLEQVVHGPRPSS